MAVLPTGLELPPLAHAVVLLAGLVLVAALLVALEPPVTQRHVVGFAPWMAVGGALHAFHAIGGLYPPALVPLFAAPAVYVTTTVLAGAVWVVVAILAAGRSGPDTAPRRLGGVGLLVLAALFAVVVVRGAGPAGATVLVWPAIAVVLSLAAAGLTLLGLGLYRTSDFVRVRYAGAVVVFAHALDGITTAVGADVYGVAERSPIPRAIMDFAAGLPTASLLGRGWLFVLVKLSIAAVIVLLFSGYVEEEPVEGSLLLTLVSAVGLGPAANNLFLFLASAP